MTGFDWGMVDPEVFGERMARYLMGDKDPKDEVKAEREARYAAADGPSDAWDEAEFTEFLSGD